MKHSDNYIVSSCFSNAVQNASTPLGHNISFSNILLSLIENLATPNSHGSHYSLLEWNILITIGILSVYCDFIVGI